jgi:hypothetical protein
MVKQNNHLFMVAYPAYVHCQASSGNVVFGKGTEEHEFTNANIFGTGMVPLVDVYGRKMPYGSLMHEVVAVDKHQGGTIAFYYLASITHLPADSQLNYNEEGICDVSADAPAPDGEQEVNSGGFSIMVQSTSTSTGQYSHLRGGQPL